jgi:hypothetical protein
MKGFNMKKLSKNLIICLLLLLGLNFSGSVMADTNQQLPDETAEQVSQLDTQKLDNSKKLTSWVQDTLGKDKTLIAVITRKGGPDVLKHDRTGMAHSGIAVYDPRIQTWIVYNLVNSVKGASPKSVLYRTALIDFFYGQTGYETEALLLIPDKPTQDRMYKAFLEGKHRELFFTDNYNLLSPYNNATSLNCNKWILMNIVAARIDNYNPDAILDAIEDGFEPGYINLSAIEFMFAKKKNNVRGYELRSKNIPTVTVESFYDSDLFHQKLFYSGKSH